jgi:hypothetical protein
MSPPPLADRKGGVSESRREGTTTLILRIFALIRYGVAPYFPCKGVAFLIKPLLQNNVVAQMTVTAPNKHTKDTPDEKDSSLSR